MHLLRGAGLLALSALLVVEMVAVAYPQPPSRVLRIGILTSAWVPASDHDPPRAGSCIGEANRGGRDGILIVQANPNLNIPGRSLEVATSHKIPTMYTNAFWAEHGALASYGANEIQQGRQAARLAHMILTGRSPGEIPVELPTEIEFVINLKTANPTVSSTMVR